MGTEALLFRRASIEDVPAMVAMLADDALGATREDVTLPLADTYLDAFRRIDTDPNQFLAIAELGSEVVGMAQLTFIPGLSHKGATRALIESVRIRSNVRGRQLGSRLIRWCIAMSRERDCHMVQLTTNKTRADAHRFYERLGFAQTHYGYKLTL